MKEKKFFSIVAVAIIFLAVMPFIISWKTHLTKSLYPTGFNLMAGGDKTVYLSYMEQARQGKWIFKNLYTSEPQLPTLFSPLWLVLGKMAWLFNLPNILIFHLARIVFAFILLYLIYTFLHYYFPIALQRKIIFILLVISSGLGIWRFLGVLIYKNVDEIFIYEHVGTDIWISEGNTFLTLLHSPLFILSQIIILGIFMLFLNNINKYKFKKSALLFLLTLFLGIFHPYDLVIVCAVLGVFLIFYFLVNKKIIWGTVKNFMFTGAAAAIAVVYFINIFKQESALSGWLEQNIIISPKFSNYILGYGLIFIFFLIGIFPIFKKIKNQYFLFVFIWSFVQLFLLYFPLQFQTKLANGLHLPLSIMAGSGFFWIWDKINKLKNINFLLNRIYKIILIIIIITALISSNFIIILLECFNYTSNKRPFYLKKEEYQAILWLKEKANEEDIILTNGDNLGNIIPSITGRVVYIGHGHQTINWDRKLVLARWFYENNNFDNIKKGWLKKENIDYVLFDKEDKNNGDLQPNQKDYLELVYKNQAVSIFKVR